jgi:hypothetical protein
VPAHVTQLGTLPRRRFESQERLAKTGSCGSLNSPKEPTPIQSFSAAAREIRRGRARGREMRPSGGVSSRYAGARRLGKFVAEGCEFAGAGPEGRSVPPIPRARAAAVGRREFDYAWACGELLRAGLAGRGSDVTRGARGLRARCYAESSRGGSQMLRAGLAGRGFALLGFTSSHRTRTCTRPIFFYLSLIPTHLQPS